MGDKYVHKRNGYVVSQNASANTQGKADSIGGAEGSRKELHFPSGQRWGQASCSVTAHLSLRGSEYQPCAGGHTHD